MLKGVRPVVAVLLLQTAIEIGKDSLVHKATWVMGIAALIIMFFWPIIHPAFGPLPCFWAIFYLEKRTNKIMIKTGIRNWPCLAS